ncbi:hypothetical protein HMPREF0058_1684, partial [Actinomyces urogenitalis DSM 15434]
KVIQRGLSDTTPEVRFPRWDHEHGLPIIHSLPRAHARVRASRRARRSSTQVR